MTMTRFAAVVVFGFYVTACGGGSGSQDAAGTDSDNTDVGAVDADDGAVDAGPADTTGTPAGDADAAETPDAGSPDDGTSLPDILGDDAGDAPDAVLVDSADTAGLGVDGHVWPDIASQDDVPGGADTATPPSDVADTAEGDDDADAEPGCPGECCDILDCVGLVEPTCCSVVVCADFTCQALPLEGCCQSDANCDDADPATIDTCAEACAADGCVNAEPVCQPLAKLNETFDDGSLGNLSSGDGSWVSAVATEAASGGFSLYFGDAECQTYFDGPIGADCSLPALSNPSNTNPLNLAASSPTLVMTPETDSYLGFWLKMAAEPAITFDLGNGPETFGTDYLSVVVKPAAGQEVVWSSFEPGALGETNTTGGEWVYQAVDLGDFAGQTISVEFVFIADTSANFNEDPTGDPWFGAYVDDVRVVEVCDDDLCSAGSTCASDGDGCTTDACTAFGDSSHGVCAYADGSPGGDCNVCVSNGDCDDGDPCFSDVCSGGSCVHQWTGSCCQPSSGFPYATAEGETASEGFEGGSLTGWVVEDDHADNVTWQIDDGMAHDGASSLYFGDPASGTYLASPPGAATATAWTPAFEVPGDAFHTSVLSFWLWLSTEFDGVDQASEAALAFDRFDVLVDQGPVIGPPVVVWSSADSLNNSTNGAWVQVGVDMSPYAGQTLQLGLRFDSVDASVNAFGGVHVDELSVSAICGLECLGSAE